MAEQPTFPAPIETPVEGPPPPRPASQQSYKSRRHSKTGGKKRSSSRRRGQSRTTITSHPDSSSSRRRLETATPTSGVRVLVPAPTTGGTASHASATPPTASASRTSLRPLPEPQGTPFPSSRLGSSIRTVKAPQ